MKTDEKQNLAGFYEKIIINFSVVEVPVQEASLREKNHLPRTRSTFESTMLSSSVGLMPPRSELLTQEWVHSTEKLSFLNLLHLNQLSQSEKSGKFFRIFSCIEFLRLVK